MTMIAESLLLASHGSEPSIGCPERRTRPDGTAPQWSSVVSERADIEAEVHQLVRSLCAGVSQRQIAKATGFNRETVRRYLAGKVTVPAEFLMALCQCHGKSLEIVAKPDGFPSPHR